MSRHILDLLISLNRREGTTLVLVTHDQTLAAYADRRILLSDGLVTSDSKQSRDRLPALVTS